MFCFAEIIWCKRMAIWSDRHTARVQVCPSLIAFIKLPCLIICMALRGLYCKHYRLPFIVIRVYGFHKRLNIHLHLQVFGL